MKMDMYIYIYVCVFSGRKEDEKRCGEREREKHVW